MISCKWSDENGFSKINSKLSEMISKSARYGKYLNVGYSSNYKSIKCLGRRWKKHEQKTDRNKINIFWINWVVIFWLNCSHSFDWIGWREKMNEIWFCIWIVWHDKNAKKKKTMPHLKCVALHSRHRITLQINRQTNERTTVYCHVYVRSSVFMLL